MKNNKKAADIQLIQRIIPHRYPFLLVDKVTEIDNLKSATGIKNVTFNEPYFQGHFPEVPIMPGVTIIEALAQTAAVMVGVSLDLADKNLAKLEASYKFNERQNLFDNCNFLNLSENTENDDFKNPYELIIQYLKIQKKT